MRWLVGLLAVLALAGCSTRVGGDPDRDREASADVEAVDLAVPLELCPVLTDGTTTTVLPDADSNMLSLAEPFLVVERIEAGKVTLQDTNWVINLTLTEQDGKAFGDWTVDHVGEQVAIVANGKVVSAPQIAEPITGGEVQIAGDYNKEEAEDFLNDLTGR